MTVLPPPGEGIDRDAPTRRPPRHPVMHQTWSHLLFLHWSVPVASLRPLVPPGLEVDTFEGRAYVGLIPFTMTGVRPAGVPAIPGLSRTHEVNVRTYVHRNGRDPGVWFFSLDANHRLAVLGARWFWSLPYFHARMRLDGVKRRPEADEPAPGTVISFASERRRPGPRPASCRIRYAPQGRPDPARAGTLEHFLVERYLLYAQGRRRLYRGQVHHAPYPLRPAEVLALEETLVAAVGIDRPAELPLAHYARQVQVEIFALEAVEA
jgi:uncharacterized protein YqjF (DUF2071 family)